MDVAELPGSTAAGKKIHFRKPSKKHTSAQAYLAVPCSSSRLGSGWLQRPRYPASPSIKEAPPTRRRAGRLVRVAYHGACCKMGAPGWTSHWPVMGGGGDGERWCAGAQQAQQASQHCIAVAEIRSVQPSKTSSPSQQPSGFTVEDVCTRWCCYLQRDFALLVLYMAVCSFICLPCALSQ
jgi:hypothetical protein